MQDFVCRLRSVLPTRWFPDDAPVLDTVLTGFAWCWEWAFDFLAYVRAQTRITTASDVWLDAIAQDYFGSAVCPRKGQSDDTYRRRILSDLVRERGTRHGLRSVLEDLTGRTPAIFEPANTADTGGYGPMPAGGSGFAYGAAGGWGSLTLPFQVFVTAYRPTGAGIASVAGWGGTCCGYGAGAIEYATLDMISGRVTDDDINGAISGVMPIATVCWTRITS